MKWPNRNILFWILPCLSAIAVFCVFLAKEIRAVSTLNINASVSLSVCGNGVIESDEECDMSAISKNCTDVGFIGGTLACDVACDFDTSLCTVPTLDPTNIAPAEINSLLAAGLFTIPASEKITSTNTLNTTSEIKINIPVAGGVDTIKLPGNMAMTVGGKYAFNPTSDMVASAVSSDQTSGFTPGNIPIGVIKWGVNGRSLNFDKPVTISIYVGEIYNGQTFNVVRSEYINGGWSNVGIIPPAKCLISGGICSFQVDKASYYAVLIPPVVNTESSSGSTPSSQNTSQTASSTRVQITSLNRIVEKMFLPSLLAKLDPNSNGSIESYELSLVIGSWVDSWSKFLGENTGAEKCDINGDNTCDLRDFSIALYFVGR